jgi:phage terminase small subunit
MAEKKLTPKQERFCREYVIDLNATQAAIRAGYSKRTAGEVGYENLRKPQIARRIAEVVNEANKKAEMSAEEVLSHLADIARARADGKLVSTGDRIRSLELYGKYLTLWTERIQQEHSGDVTFNMVMQAEKRTKGTQ